MLYPSELQPPAKDYYSFTTIQHRDKFSVFAKPL
jgi:hypothetical protein